MHERDGREELAFTPAGPADRTPVEELLRSCDLPAEDLPASLDHFFVARAGDRLAGCIGLEVVGRRGLVRSSRRRPSASRATSSQSSSAVLPPRGRTASATSTTTRP